MTRTILIVDDILSNRLILNEMLKEDYCILEAAGGQAALAVLAEKHTAISAVLLDIIMPDMDGFEVLRRIRTDAAFAQMPVIMITGSKDEASRVKALSLGANDYVMKPYSSDILKHCLRNNIALREASLTVNALERDRLTGLWNREAFFLRAAQYIEKEPAGYFVLGCADIDGFKVINDQYGNEVGDRILNSVAAALRQSCNDHGGICSRLFADQFVGLFPRTLLGTDAVGPQRLEERILEDTGVSVTLSVGRYIIEDKSLGITAMFDRASIAKSTVKGRYDTHIALYDGRMRDQILYERTIVNEMNAALAQRQFEVWFQPQYNHATDAMIGAEALIRWRHPKRGLIPPGDFIHIFEQNGFIYTMDKFVWEEVCRCLWKWIDVGRSPLPVSVNISRYDVLRPDVIEVLTGLVAKYGLPMDLLRLEITETAFSESSQRVVDVVKELLARGFTVEIDDFGSGYSSLNTLKDVPAQIIKLDMKFLASSDDSQRGGNIVESIVRMAKWLGMSVIAEGVETPEQADYLRSIGCNYMQGYLYARPMPIDAYETHCSGSSKEERLLTLETVENLDNNAFWDPRSMDTLIFNSYVGAACIYEYHNHTIELVRATEKYAQVIGSAGMTVEDALKLNWAEHLNAENIRRVISDIEESIRTKSEVTGEYVFLNLPNCSQETYLRSTMRVIAVAGERYLVYCTNENVTAQRQAERKAQEAAAQIQHMMDDMPGGFVRMHIAADGAIQPIYINDGFVKLLGTSHDAIMAIYAKDAMAGVHPDDVSIVKDVLARMFQNGVAQSARYRLQRGDGSYIWLSVLGRVTTDASGETYLNVYYTDVSQQVREEETQKALLDNLPCGAGVYTFKDGQMSLTYQNKSYWELVGLYEEAYPDSAPMSAVHPDDIPVIMGELSAAIQQNRDVSCDIRLRHLSLGYRPVHLVGRIVHTEAGGFLIYATFMPIDTADGAGSEA